MRVCFGGSNDVQQRVPLEPEEEEESSRSLGWNKLAAAGAKSVSTLSFGVCVLPTSDALIAGGVLFSMTEEERRKRNT